MTSSYERRKKALRKLRGQSNKVFHKAEEAVLREQAARRKARQTPEISKKLGRNDLCPCHSGKKWKDCCQLGPYVAGLLQHLFQIAVYGRKVS